jgi:hypothetical protein
MFFFLSFIIFFYKIGEKEVEQVLWGRGVGVDTDGKVVGKGVGG